MKFNKFVLAAMVASAYAEEAATPEKTEEEKAAEAKAAADLAACTGVTFSTFAEAKCAGDKTDVATEKVADELKCKGADKLFYTAACTADGIKYTAFSDAECKTAGGDDVTAEYDKCYTVSGKSFKVAKAAAATEGEEEKTGAFALKASAIVLAAFVGSQF